MCEETITSFLRQHFGFERIPVPTEAVTMLIERDAADLDLATDLSDDIHEVFGFTQFERGRKPLVKIARELWEQRHRNNRLRTTLAHEYGHVMLHTWLYDKYGAARRSAPLLLAELASDRAAWLTGLSGRQATPQVPC